VAVLDAVLHVAAVDPRVVGPQLGEQQRGVGVALVEDGQGGAEAIVLAYLHPVPPGYQDLHLPALRDEGPLDPGGSQDRPAPGRAGGGLGTEVGDEAGDGDVARQHGVEGWVAWDGDLQSLEVLWVGEEGSHEPARHGVPPPRAPPQGQGAARARLRMPSYLCHLQGQNPPGPPRGQTPRAAAAGGLRPSSALRGRRKSHQWCFKPKESVENIPSSHERPQPTCAGLGGACGFGAQRERPALARPWGNRDLWMVEREEKEMSPG